MRITALRTENVKRLTAVSITPDGNVVVIGGKNGAGKSSVLDSILYALAGGKSLPGKPVRNGEEKAEIEVRLDGDPPLIVKRRIKADGAATLEILQDHGNGVTASIKSPQKLLDSLIGRIAFDPLEFVRQKPAEQVATLQDIVSIDTAEIDAEIERLFEERADANRELKRLQGLAGSLPQHEGVGTEEESAAEVLAELNEAREHNSKVDGHFKEADRLDGVVVAARTDLAIAQKKVNDLREQVRAAEAAASQMELSLQQAQTAAKNRRQEAELLDRVPLEPIEAKLSGLEDANRMARENRAAAAAIIDRDKAQEYADELTTRIDEARQRRLDLMKAAKWPIEGLGFGDGGVTFNGLPFGQCSSAEQLRISTAIGMSQHAALNVLFIRDGSLLDQDSLSAIASMADQHGSQVWIERVSDGEECSVIIESGAVKETRPAKGRKPELQTA